MELPTGEVEMPLPLNSAYGGGCGGGGGRGGGGATHMMHHDSTNPPPPPHLNTTTPNNGLSMPSTVLDDHNHSHHLNHHAPPPAAPTPPPPPSLPFSKKIVRYRECLKNHAAAMGGNATDGCGEFMPSGEEGTLEALTCSACNCHRNFHRKEVEGEATCDGVYNLTTPHHHLNRVGRKLLVGHHHHHHQAFGYHSGTIIPNRANAAPPPPLPAPPHHHQMIMSYNMGSLSLDPSEDEQEEVGGVVMARPSSHHHHHHQLVKKRFRTKFTPEQKEKMLQFADRVGWKMQKTEESVVQQFCQEIGVKRRVLKVWMHNNKHNLAKKSTQNSSPINVHQPQV